MKLAIARDSQYSSCMKCFLMVYLLPKVYVSALYHQPLTVLPRPHNNVRVYNFHNYGLYTNHLDGSRRQSAVNMISRCLTWSHSSISHFYTAVFSHVSIYSLRLPTVIIRILHVRLKNNITFRPCVSHHKFLELNFLCNIRFYVG